MGRCGPRRSLPRVNRILLGYVRAAATIVRQHLRVGSTDQICAVRGSGALCMPVNAARLADETCFKAVLPPLAMAAIQIASMVTSDACRARARRSARSPVRTVPPGSATAATRASTADPVCASVRSQAARRASGTGTLSATSQVRRNRWCAASLDPSPVRDSIKTTEGTTGGHKPSARRAVISAAARGERSAGRVTAPESRTSIQGRFGSAGPGGAPGGDPLRDGLGAGLLLL